MTLKMSLKFLHFLINLKINKLKIIIIIILFSEKFNKIKISRNKLLDKYIYIGIFLFDRSNLNQVFFSFLSKI